MSRPRESSLKRSVISYLKAAWPTACVRKRHGSAFTVAGDPDVYALIGGVHLEIELKVPGENPTPLQNARSREWEKAGAYWAVIHTKAELCSFLDGLVTEGILPAPAKG